MNIEQLKQAALEASKKGYNSPEYINAAKALNEALKKEGQPEIDPRELFIENNDKFTYKDFQDMFKDKYPDVKSMQAAFRQYIDAGQAKDANGKPYHLAGPNKGIDGIAGITTRGFATQPFAKDFARRVYKGQPFSEEHYIPQRAGADTNTTTTDANTTQDGTPQPQNNQQNNQGNNQSNNQGNNQSNNSAGQFPFNTPNGSQWWTGNNPQQQNPNSQVVYSRLNAPAKPNFWNRLGYAFSPNGRMGERVREYNAALGQGPTMYDGTGYYQNRMGRSDYYPINPGYYQTGYENSDVRVAQQGTGQGQVPVIMTRDGRTLESQEAPTTRTPRRFTSNRRQRNHEWLMENDEQYRKQQEELDKAEAELGKLPSQRDLRTQSRVSSKTARRNRRAQEKLTRLQAEMERRRGLRSNQLGYDAELTSESVEALGVEKAAKGTIDVGKDKTSRDKKMAGKKAQFDGRVTSAQASLDEFDAANKQERTRIPQGYHDGRTKYEYETGRNMQTLRKEDRNRRYNAGYGSPSQEDLDDDAEDLLEEDADDKAEGLKPTTGMFGSVRGTIRDVMETPARKIAADKQAELEKQQAIKTEKMNSRKPSIEDMNKEEQEAALYNQYEIKHNSKIQRRKGGYLKKKDGKIIAQSGVVSNPNAWGDYFMRGITSPANTQQPNTSGNNSNTFSFSGSNSTSSWTGKPNPFGQPLLPDMQVRYTDTDPNKKSNTSTSTSGSNNPKGKGSNSRLDRGAYYQLAGTFLPATYNFAESMRKPEFEKPIRNPYEGDMLNFKQSQRYNADMQPIVSNINSNLRNIRQGAPNSQVQRAAQVAAMNSGNNALRQNSLDEMKGNQQLANEYYAAKHAVGGERAAEDKRVREANLMHRVTRDNLRDKAMTQFGVGINDFGKQLSNRDMNELSWNLAAQSGRNFKGVDYNDLMSNFTDDELVVFKEQGPEVAIQLMTRRKALEAERAKRQSKSTEKKTPTQGTGASATVTTTTTN